MITFHTQPNRIAKSRYDSVDLYINPDPKYAFFNDLDVKVDEQSYNTLIDNGIDPMLAKHIAHLFIRDALVTYDDYADKDDMQSSEHFEVWIITTVKYRIFSHPIGRVSVGNHQLLVVLWRPGVWSFVQWRSC